MNEIPEGFGEPRYTCRNHPERNAVSPIALRMCAECLETAVRNYAEQHAFTATYRYQDERAPDGRSIYLDHIGWYRPKKEQII